MSWLYVVMPGAGTKQTTSCLWRQARTIAVSLAGSMVTYTTLSRGPEREREREEIERERAPTYMYNCVTIVPN